MICGILLGLLHKTFSLQPAIIMKGLKNKIMAYIEQWKQLTILEKHYHH